MIIIGITGTDGAGKGEVVKYLVEKRDFVHYHGRALFLEEIEKRGLPKNRENMRLVANDLRRRFGNDYIVRLFIECARERGDENIIIDSIRAIAEVEKLKKHDGILIAVDTDQKIRYERIQSRASESDTISFEEFIRQETLEMDDPDPSGMQKAKVIEIADYLIVNNGSVEELHRQVEGVLKKIESPRG